jgi:hypothetical protein
MAWCRNTTPFVRGIAEVGHMNMMRGSLLDQLDLIAQERWESVLQY